MIKIFYIECIFFTCLSGFFICGCRNHTGHRGINVTYEHLECVCSDARRNWSCFYILCNQIWNHDDSSSCALSTISKKPFFHTDCINGPSPGLHVEQALPYCQWPSRLNLLTSPHYLQSQLEIWDFWFCLWVFVLCFCRDVTEAPTTPHRLQGMATEIFFFNFNHCFQVFFFSLRPLIDIFILDIDWRPLRPLWHQTLHWHLCHFPHQSSRSRWSHLIRQ